MISFPPSEETTSVEIIKGPNIQSFPQFPPLSNKLCLPVILKLGDNISTDDISPAGTAVLPYRSNIPRLSEFTYYKLDETFHKRAVHCKKRGSVIIAGRNYGQGSSREHAAIAPRYLGVKVVIAKSYARIHRKNLINFGILPFIFNREKDYDKIDLWDELNWEHLLEKIPSQEAIEVFNETKKEGYLLDLDLSSIEIESLLAGSLITVIKKKHAS